MYKCDLKNSGKGCRVEGGTNYGDKEGAIKVNEGERKGRLRVYSFIVGLTKGRRGKCMVLVQEENR